MKKYLLLLLFFLLMPIYSVNAKVQALDLKETLSMEEIDLKYKDYTETSDQIIVYLFWGLGCNHCYNFVNYLNDIAEENGYMFKLRSYEVSQNIDNQTLKENAIKLFNIEAPGVPLIIIGESTFYGFSESTESKILKAIKNEYNSDKKYDMVEEMSKESHLNDNNAILVLGPIIAIILIYYIVKLIKKDDNIDESETENIQTNQK